MSVSLTGKLRRNLIEIIQTIAHAKWSSHQLFLNLGVQPSHEAMDLVTIGQWQNNTQQIATLTLRVTSSSPVAAQAWLNQQVMYTPVSHMLV